MNISSPDFLKNLYDHISEGVIVTNLSGIIIDVNNSFCKITGYSKEDIIGKTPKILSSGLQDSNFYSEMWLSLSKNGEWRGEIWNKRKSGEIYIELLSITKVFNDKGIGCYVGLFSDITEIKKREEILLQRANYDTLTGLPNKVFLYQLFPIYFSKAQRNKTKVIICYLDLDEFKQVNDKYGHDKGDDLLYEVARILKQTVRTTDVVSRIGGDEFIIVLTDVKDNEYIEVIERILKRISQPITLDKIVVTISGSIGISTYPMDGIDVDKLIRNADQSMYIAKQSGKNKFLIYDVNLDKKTKLFHENLNLIKEGILHNQFCMFYQPKIDMQSGKIIGVEALVRWCHPTKGILPPGEFLHIIEGTTCEVNLGNWIVEDCIKQAQEWHELGYLISVSINISSFQLKDTFYNFLSELLKKYPKVIPSLIEIEILETTFIDDINYISKIIRDCNSLGITFALDDFGTGYSSLSYLKRLPIDTIKIDRSFIKNLDNDPDDIVIIEGIASLAESFDKQIIAEGVETEDQGTTLIRLGCNLAQGFLISKPIRPKDIINFIDNYSNIDKWKSTSRWTKDNFKLLSMKSEHQKWVKEFIKYLHGNRSIDGITLNPHCCNFAKWYYSKESKKYSHLAEFQDLILDHDEVHIFGMKKSALIESKVDLDINETIDELTYLSNKFLTKLEKLYQAI